jgi:hypothetical protein
MRAGAALVLTLILVAAAAVLLRKSEVEHRIDNVYRMAEKLREEGVTGTKMDPDTARYVIDNLEMLLRQPQAIPSHVEDLRTVTGMAASWAEGAPSPSAQLHVAVSIRRAADSLREYAVSPSDRHIERATAQLGEARAALEGRYQPAGPTDVIRDRLKNLERSHLEKFTELDDQATDQPTEEQSSEPDRMSAGMFVTTTGPAP